MSHLHLFIPHHSNNHKPRLLHSSRLTSLLILLVVSQIAIGILSRVKPSILGYATFIPPQEIINLTNREREKVGLNALKENPKLTAAAQAKAANMFAKNYWAHNAPDGTQPWFFILNAGYNYLHAGENLARDFRNADSAVVAWTKSPTHMANLISPKYQEIGVAVVDGKLNGVDTTLIVQMFGTSQAAAQAQLVSGEQTSVQNTLIKPVLAQEASLINPTLFTPFDISRSISLAFIILITITLAIDWFVVWRRNLIRISGKTWAHLTFMATMIFILIILKQGLIK